MKKPLLIVGGSLVALIGLGVLVGGVALLVIFGTDGYIELRKYVDIAGRPGDNHLFLVDKKGTQHIDCREVPLPFGARFLSDIADRTDTAMDQEHCFLACELALTAQAKAARLL